MHKRLALTVLPLALVTACGGSSSSAPKTITQTTTVTTTQTPTSTSSNPSDADATATDTTETDAATDATSTDPTEESTSPDVTEESTSTDPTTTPAAAGKAPSGGGQYDAAVSSARSYLGTSAFSKQGLIDQLSSPYGEQFPLAIATRAVNSLTDVNWNAQAVKSAQSYVSTQAFSCAGLTDQLSSAYGEKFTPAQAAYGASQTSACK